MASRRSKRNLSYCETVKTYLLPANKTKSGIQMKQDDEDKSKAKYKCLQDEYFKKARPR